MRQLIADAVDQRCLLGAMRRELMALRQFKHSILALAADRYAVLARHLHYQGVEARKARQRKEETQQQ